MPTSSTLVRLGLLGLALSSFMTPNWVLANSTIYRCTGPDGKIVLQQGPCASDAKQHVRTVHTPSIHGNTKPTAPRPSAATNCPQCGKK